MAMITSETHNTSFGELPKQNIPLSSQFPLLTMKAKVITNNTLKKSLKTFAKKCWDGLFKVLKPNGLPNISETTTNGSKSKPEINKLEMITDTQEKKVIMFQWTRGDRMGQIVKAIDTVVDDNMEFFVFEDGSQCNTKLVGEWIVPIESIYDAPILVNEIQDLQMIRDQGGRMEKLEPFKTMETKSESPNPIYDLLKISKKKPVKLQLTISVEMPAEELIKVVQESYANGSKLIGDYLTSSVDQSSVMKQIETILRSKVEEVTKKKRTKNENIS